MRVLILAAMAALTVSGCVPSNPFDRAARKGVSTLEGTSTPTANASISLYEPEDQEGSGTAKAITYNRTSNTYQVDNLAFDGANNYRRNTAGSAVLPWTVYEATTTEIDPRTGQPIDQLVHRLIGQESRTGRTRFAIVRTGSYVTYGFGGFVLERDGGVVMPTTGQARYDGNIAGLRDMNGLAGLTLTRGRMQVAIDFADFNSGEGVKGDIFDRRFYDLNGNDVTAAYVAEMNSEYELTGTPEEMTELPVMHFAVRPGTIDEYGQLEGELDSTVWDRRGELTRSTFEKGRYYAILSGENADELVGVIVVKAPNPRVEGVTDRETGGFILYRPE